MKIILSGWKRYNANSKNNNVGDCVKRSLAYAYGVDYDEISRRLNRIKNEIHAAAFNNRSVFTKFLNDNGAQRFSRIPKDMTEEEFCKEYSWGVYIILSGTPDKTYSTHMVCIMNGDIIDSWNSSNYIVRDVWAINNVHLDTYEVNWEDIKQELDDYIDNYLQGINKKYSSWFIARREGDKKLDDVTGRLTFILETQNLPMESDYIPNYTYGKRVVIKINPRLTVEKNIQSLQAKLKQRVYDWIYPFQKDMRDVEAIKDMVVDKAYYDDSESKKALLQLPEWCRSSVVEFFVDHSSNPSFYKYDLTLRPSAGDKNRDNVKFYADTLTELKSMLRNYYEDYTREY